MTAPTFMILPSLACQASCKYCFGPHEGPVMDERTARETISFIQRIAEETAARDISIVFHGGEPLLAPFPVWKALFDEIRSRFCGYRLSMSLQSNLWNLNDSLLRLFYESGVAIGTSLDGPKDLCDQNRGEGYFDKTYPSLIKACKSGCSVSAIATVSKETLPHVREIAQFFRDDGLPLVLHGALPAMGAQASPLALSSDEYADMILSLYPWYIENRKYIKIDTLDQYVNGFVDGEPGVCTLRDCLGMFLCISPTGDITSCQRLAGCKEFRLGSIWERPSLTALYESTAAETQRKREEQVRVRCAACEVYPICKGGCYYNALSSGDNVIDPLCGAYRKIYSFVQDRVLEEMASPKNREAVASRPPMQGEHPLLRHGAYSSLSKKTHPVHFADNARHILALHEIGKTADPREAAENLYRHKICGDPADTERILENIKRNLHASKGRKNNCYAHVTWGCNLRCSHCYANAGDRTDEMSPDAFARIMEAAIGEGFRQFVLTGGEPLTHTGRDNVLKACKNNKGRGTNLVLRTNLTGDFTEADFRTLAISLDQVVVSVDGSEETHDTRRGLGTYQNMTRNLYRYQEIAAPIPNAAELSLACVMRAEDVNGGPGESVRALGERLGVERVRFRPLLPLGRAENLDEPVMCEGLMQHMTPEEMLQADVRPLSTCGIGQNLFIEPDGGAYPCYAWHSRHTFLGNVLQDGMRAVLTSPPFTRLTECTVDTIENCRDCEFRYLCGSACRAWGNQDTMDLNAAPVRCDHLKERAQRLIETARALI